MFSFATGLLRAGFLSPGSEKWKTQSDHRKLWVVRGNPAVVLNICKATCAMRPQYNITRSHVRLLKFIFTSILGSSVIITEALKKWVQLHSHERPKAEPCVLMIYCKCIRSACLCPSAYITTQVSLWDWCHVNLLFGSSFSRSFSHTPSALLIVLYTLYRLHTRMFLTIQRLLCRFGWWLIVTQIIMIANSVDFSAYVT